MTEPLRYLDLNTYLRNRFGCRVQKVTLDAGFTCPNRDGTKGTGGCVYCNEKGSGTGAHRRGEDLRTQLRKGIAFCRSRYKAKKFIAYFQAFSNTYAPVPVLRRIYMEALSEPDVVGLSIGTRPDCVDADKLDLLAELARDHMVWIEYGLQSAWDDTLRRIHRGHSAEDFARAVRETHARNLPVCAHVILGLPGEDRDRVRDTARFCASLDMEGVKLHQLYVLRGTPLERDTRAGLYRPLSQDEYVEWAVDVIERLPPTTVVQRLTGDPDPSDLVAPTWSLDKQETRNKIARRLRERDTRQGAKYGIEPLEIPVR